MIAKVLIVEDMVKQAQDRERYLKKAVSDSPGLQGIKSFSVNLATCGVHARLLLKQAMDEGTPYHILLSDLQLPENEGDSHQSIQVGLEIVRYAKETSAAFQVIAISAFTEQLLNSLRSGVDDFIEKPVKPADLISRFFLAWQRLLKNECRKLETERVLSLLPQAQLAWVPRFRTSFSEFLRSVVRISENLRLGLEDRFEIDFTTDPTDSLMIEIQRLSGEIGQAKKLWEQTIEQMAAGESAPPDGFETASLNSVIEGALRDLEPIMIFRDVCVAKFEAQSADVSGYPKDLAAVIREILIGALLDKGANGSKPNVEINLEQDGPFVRLRVRDWGPQISERDISAINDCFPINPDKHFSRAWGLSIVQHTAIRGGGKLHVSASNNVNEVLYLLPLAITR